MKVSLNIHTYKILLGYTQYKKPMKSQYFCQLKWLRCHACTLTIKS